MKKDDKIAAKMIFDSYDFYHKGGVFLKLERGLSDRLDTEICNLDWQFDEEEGQLSPVGIRPTAEDEFDQENSNYNSNINPNFPKGIRDVIEELLLSNVFYQMSCTYDFKINVADIWDGCDKEGLPWHFDGVTSDDIIMMFYLSENKDWKPEDGGNLEIGIRTEKYIGDPDLFICTDNTQSVKRLCAIPPKKRNVAILNNKNPYQLHQVKKIMKEGMSRRTMLVGMNILMRPTSGEKGKVIWNFDD